MNHFSKTTKQSIGDEIGVGWAQNDFIKNKINIDKHKDSTNQNGY